MVITYSNEHGKIRLNGTGKDNAWCINEISGIGFLKKNYTYNTYAGVMGHELSSQTIPSRVITISGDIPKAAQNSLSMSRVVKILNTDGELNISTKNKHRRAKVRTLDFSADEKRSVFKKFVLQLESDIPYFFGGDIVKYNLFSRKGVLSSPFVLGETPFSVRTTYADVINTGDVECEPIIIINKPTFNDNNKYERPLVIKNETTDTSLTLNHILSPGETVTIDIPNRKITSNMSGNLINTISIDSVLRDFILLPGKNKISFDSDDKTLRADCVFDALYLEASHDE